VSAIKAHPDYSLCGWRFRSEIPIEALPVWDGDSDRPPDVELVRGEVAEVSYEDLVGVVITGRSTATVATADAGRFAIFNGNRVVADVHAGAFSGFVETMIVGPVLGVLSYQRGILSLHANTVVINGKAIALAGRSGAGKSTLAAILLKRGHPLISDDVLPIIERGGQTIAMPGSQNLRLWGETLDLLGVSREGLRHAADSTREKYYLPTISKTTKPWPLAALIWLERGITERYFFRPANGIFRTRAILKSTYRTKLAREFATMGTKELQDLTLPGVAVFDLLRPRGLDLLEEQATAIERLALEDDLPGMEEPFQVRAAQR